MSAINMLLMENTCEVIKNISSTYDLKGSLINRTNKKYEDKKIMMDIDFIQSEDTKVQLS